MQPDKDNSIFHKAVSFVKYTDQNLFLTGKAGTGKTTFLKYIRDTIKKKSAVIAPTGVAAINAGGETIHSFLQVPIGPFIPANARGFTNENNSVNDKNSLLSKIRFKDSKLKLLNKLELLIIDEVSMVRCDLMDEIDLILRFVRKKWELPFGGIQMVFIGDLFQLPPVVQNEEWDILSGHYASPFFFDSVVMKHHPPLYLELSKIYRQKDEKFIDILNNIRGGLATDRDIIQLNKQYNPQLKENEEYIVLSTHNRTVNEINNHSLEKLQTPLFSFEAEIEKDFNPRNFPTEQTLQLKEGAQVMFIRNDTRTPRRYYNGKIAKVSKIDKTSIQVTFQDVDPVKTLILEKEKWKNIRFSLNKTNNEIIEDELGSFTQYPVRLAWAVTVHKSQGLTLQKVIVDLDRSFASGQVYVALSRCTTLEGIVLKSKLSLSNILVDERIREFSTYACDEDELDRILEHFKRESTARYLCKVFSFTDLIAEIEKLQLLIAKRKYDAELLNVQLIDSIVNALKIANEHAKRFHSNINTHAKNRQDDMLNERISAAIKYFTEQVLSPLANQTERHLALLGTISKIAKLEVNWKNIKQQLLKKRGEIAECFDQI